jgi:hypothetical protein
LHEEVSRKCSNGEYLVVLNVVKGEIVIGQYKLYYLCEYGHQDRDFEIFVCFDGIVVVVVRVPEFVSVDGQPYEGVDDGKGKEDEISLNDFATDGFDCIAG